MLGRVLRRILELIYCGLELTATIALGAVSAVGLLLFAFLRLFAWWVVPVLGLLLLQFVAKHYVALLLVGFSSLLLASLIRGLLLDRKQVDLSRGKRRIRVPEYEILDDQDMVTTSVEIAARDRSNVRAQLKREA